MMCVPTTFLVLNGDLVGHMSFVKRKIIAKPVTAVTRDLRCQNFLRILGFLRRHSKYNPPSYRFLFAKANLVRVRVEIRIAVFKLKPKSI